MPFIYERVIHWGDTDSANIVYTGKYFEYSLEAIEAWFRMVVGVDWYELNINQNIGTPFVHVDMDFKSMLTPKNILYVKVYVEKYGTSSLTFKLLGERDDGILSFEANYVCCIISRPDNKVISIPSDMLNRIKKYIEFHDLNSSPDLKVTNS